MTRKDIIGRDVLKRLTNDLARHLLGLDSEAIDLLETQHQRIEERRADLVARMRSLATGEQFILHIEVVNDNRPEMPVRMLRYRTDIQLAWPAEPIRQCLIYIGARPLAMATGVEDAPELGYRFRLVDMHRVDCQALLAQDNPDALVLAILCDFGGRPAHEVVTEILLRLKRLTGHDERRRGECLAMLELLSENRGLEDVIAEAEEMLTQVDIEKLPSYRLGDKKGEHRGREQGRAEGRAEGRQEGEHALLQKLLERRFGPLPPEVTARLAAADTDQLERWGLALLEARTLDEVFAG